MSPSPRRAAQEGMQQGRPSLTKTRKQRRGKPNRGFTCSNCRSRKTRCDGTQPSCKTCEVYNDQCRYDKPPPMSQINMMAKKLQDAERIIANLQAAIQSGTRSIDHSPDHSRADTQLEASSPRPCESPQLPQGESETLIPTPNSSPSYARVKSPETGTSGSLISDISLDENGKLCYYGPTSAVHDPSTIESIKTGDQHYDSPSAKSNVRSLLTSKAMESRAWEDFAAGNAAFRSDIPRHTLSRLLKIHWTWVAPMFMWVYRPAFMRDMSTGGPYFSEFLLVVLCAHTARFLDGNIGELLISRARLLLGTEIQRPSSIPTVQALLQLSARDLACGSISQAWLYSGMAFRMVSDLGLHHSSGKLLEFGYLTAEDIEIRRRLFWSCYFWDKAISLYLGRMPTLTELPFDHSPELLDTFAEHELWSPYYGEPGDIFQVPTSQYPATTSYAISCFENSCRLAVIISNIMTRFYSRRGTPNTDEEFRRLRGSLDEWRTNSPSHLVYKPENLPAISPPPHILTQNLLYYTTIILLHRPFYSSQIHRAACRNAANSLEKLLLLLETTFGFTTRITYLMAYCIYTGASVMVQDVNAGDLEAKGKMNTFLRALKCGLKTCPVVQRSIEIIKNGLKNGAQSRAVDIDESLPENTMRNYLPAFPYGDTQMALSNDSSYSLADLDAFALLDSFPENHMDTVAGGWYLPS
ncbi:fungal-specific transcription factor domain-containing protein [Xylogone sp. PMI_703]|nr:fungal-specific transcription factor domain-containing protein [Xylogone sp. PMI_703]